jgi:signal transduction histidine kinase
VLQRVVRMLQMVAQEKEIELTCTVEDGAVAMATEDDIHQIFYNLMENAIKYSPQGGFVHTDVAVEGQAVVIRVEDNGIGIPEEDLTHVFERFYRVDKARSRAIGGTGLGLSIVRDTVLRREGTIEAQHRADGPGTVFIVRLPLAEGGETA